VVLTGAGAGGPSPPAEETAEEPGLAFRWLRRLVPAAFLVAVAVLAGRQLAALDLRAARIALKTLPALPLAAVLAMGLVAVAAMTLYDFWAARALAIRLPAARLLRYSWVANSFNNLVGLSGLAASGIRFLLLAREGVEPRKGAAYAAIVMLSGPVGLAVLCWPLLLTGLPARAGLPVPPWVAVAAVGGFALYVPVYGWLLKGRGPGRRVLAGAGPLAWRTPVLLATASTLDWLLAAAVGWTCLWATGASLPMGAFLAAYVLASVAAILSQMPGGLGVLDGLMLVLLAPLAGAAGPVLAGLVLFRVAYYLVPWGIGVWLGAGLLVSSGAAQRSRVWRLMDAAALPAFVRLPVALLAVLGIRVLSWLTLGAGIILLLSAAFPALADRLAVLRQHLPLAAIETSHLLSVGTGVLLIALSRGIGDQVLGAYRAAMALLVAGAVFSLLKGIDFEEAAALLAVAALLRTQRARFYRRGHPVLSARSLFWAVGLLAALAGYALLGTWVYGDIGRYSGMLLRFAPTAEAPRYFRSLLFALVVALGYLAGSLFRSRGPTLALPGKAELDEARGLLDRCGGGVFGHIILMGDKHLFWPPERRAVIAFGRVRDRLVALGGPLGEPAAADAAVAAFRDYADRYGMLAVFYEVTEPEVHRYHDAGFSLFKLGESAWVATETFTLEGKRGQDVRHGANRAKRDGAAVEMVEPPFAPEQMAELKAVSDAWLAGRGAAEKGFSLGRFDPGYVNLAPVAVVRAAGRAVAFASLMPGYGGREALSVDLMRHVPDAPPGTMDLLFAELIAHARAEGYRWFNLGMAPLAGVGETRYARPRERMARLAFEHGNRLYSYKGLRSFKEKFHPEWRGSYLAYPPFTPLPMLLIDIAALVAGGYRRIVLRGREREPGG
jgi:phosphatidylglycerol lysyltransferase